MAWPPIEDMRVRIGLLPDDATRDADILLAQDISLDMVETYLDRKLMYEDDVEEFFSASMGHLVRRWPLDPDEEIKITGKGFGSIDGNYVWAVGVNEYGAGHYFAIDFEKGIIYSPSYAYGWPLEISYTGGFEVLPPTLQWALLRVFDLVWASDSSFGNTSGSTVTTGAVKKVSLVGIGSVELDSGGSSSSSGDSGGINADAWGLLPATVTSVLDRWRRESAVGVG